MVKVKMGPVLVLMLVLLLMMAGCGGSKAPAPAAPQPAPAAPAPAPAPKEVSLAEIFDKGKNIDGLYYEYVMTSGPVKIEAETWVQEKKIRYDVVTNGQSVSTIVDLEQKVAYNYMPEQKVAMKVNLSMIDLDSFRLSSAWIEKLDPNTFNILETVMYNGLKCKVVEGQEDLKMWISEEYGIPIRVEITVSGQKTLIEYKNLKVSLIDADTFKIPQGIQIIETGR